MADYMCVNERKAGGKVRIQGAEVKRRVQAG